MNPYKTMLAVVGTLAANKGLKIHISIGKDGNPTGRGRFVSIETTRRFIPKRGGVMGETVRDLLRFGLIEKAPTQEALFDTETIYQLNRTLFAEKVVGLMEKDLSHQAKKRKR